MSDDVTIPREDARKWAGALRDAFDQLGGSAPLALIGLADLLDPPAPSLRDEVAAAIRAEGWTCDYHEPDTDCGDCVAMTDAVLAVVRRHVDDPPQGHLAGPRRRAATAGR